MNGLLHLVIKQPAWFQGWVLEDCPRPRGHLEDKIWRPWPWPRTCLALALVSNQHGLGLDAVLLRLGVLVPVAGIYANVIRNIAKIHL
jgi:hypothetical protein